MSRELSVFEYHGTGYGSVFTYGAWKLAMIRDSAACHRENMRVASRHMATDEAFVLLEGEAALYLGGQEAVPGTFVKHPLLPGKVYVVHAGTWHVTVTDPGCHVLVAENADTGAENTQKITYQAPFLPEA